MAAFFYENAAIDLHISLHYTLPEIYSCVFVRNCSHRPCFGCFFNIETQPKQGLQLRFFTKTQPQISTFRSHYTLPEIYSCVFFKKCGHRPSFGCVINIETQPKHGFQLRYKRRLYRIYSGVYYRNAAIGVNLLVVNKRSYMVYKTQLQGDLQLRLLKRDYRSPQGSIVAENRPHLKTRL